MTEISRLRLRPRQRDVTPFVVALLLLGAAPCASAEIIGFEDVALPGPETFYNGNPGNPPLNTPIDGTFQSGSATFVNTFTRFDFGSGPFDYWEGWSCSNVTDQTTSGIANQYSAWNPSAGGGGADGSETYGVSFGQDAWVQLPQGMVFDSLDITNTVYTALSMKNGDSFAKKFGGADGTDPDYLKLTISGSRGGVEGTEVFSTDFYLADYRFEDSQDDYIVDEWTTVDLTSFGGADTLRFNYESSDVGMFGINTPLYFAADQFRGSAIPEPGGLLVLAGVTAVAVWRRRRARGLGGCPE